jgi:hypothetical protein
MSTPKVTPRSTGTVPVGVASGPTLQDRTIVNVPWNKASVLHRKGEGHFVNPDGIQADAEKVEIPEGWLEAKQASLPKVVRRTSRQRAEVLATDLFKLGLPSYRALGRAVWPQSIQDILVRLGADNKPIYGQVDALVGYLMLKNENKQRENDSRQVARGWHGHYD